MVKKKIIITNSVEQNKEFGGYVIQYIIKYK